MRLNRKQPMSLALSLATIATSLLAQGAVAQAAIPDSFEDLLAELREGRSELVDTHQYTSTNRLVVPFSRALHRELADPIEPRDIVSIRPEDTESNAPFFLGHVPRSNTVEVIRWNRKAKRFDFLLIEDFKQGGKPRLVEPNRALCLSCHQGGGPIFSHLPWQETSASPLIAKLVNEERKKAGLAAHPGFYVPSSDGLILINHDRGVDFSRHVGNANQDLAIAAFCKTGCGSDIECRRAYLAASLMAFSRASLSAKLARSEEIDRFIEEMDRRLPADRLAHISSVLPDRDPFGGPEGTTKFAGKLDPRLAARLPVGFSSKQVSFDPDFGSYSELFSVTDLFGQSKVVRTRIPEPLPFETILGITGPVDPKTTRPLVSAIPLGGVPDGWEALNHPKFEFLVRSASVCFNLRSSDNEAMSLPGQGISKLLQEDAKVTELLSKDWPPSTQELAIYLRTRFPKRPQGAAPSAFRAIRDELQPVQSEAAIVSQDSNLKDRAQALFGKYCASCHAGSGANNSGYPLPLADPAQLRAYKVKQGLSKALKLLRNEEMPPKDELEDATAIPSEEERSFMIRFLEQQE